MKQKKAIGVFKSAVMLCALKKRLPFEARLGRPPLGCRVQSIPLAGSQDNEDFFAVFVSALSESLLSHSDLVAVCQVTGSGATGLWKKL